ncbi:TatD family hydrolase [Iamia sp. SCSIO 61187]|uniref:TatD family hydrolase n=1 Tax=Iamia sp. SCSIO 61187 TaxID=2722752 RepID=UPI001C62D789|nr:TatD family hydrolase [Iamia sp. SCSIO 61187]
MPDATLRWADDHCHLHHAGRTHVGHQYAPADEVAEVVDAAAAVGVERMITVGCGVADSIAAADAAAAHPGRLWATAGVHPHEAQHGIEGLEAVLGRPEVVAVGECGLDFHYDHSPRDAQRDVFAAQIALAHAHDLPLVIHTREAWAETFAILDAEGTPRRTVFHCFTGDADDARGCLDRGAVLSISGLVTFPKADDIRAAVAVAPLDALMVETDSPFLTPVPLRGKPNLPGYLPLVGEGIAAVKGIAVDEVAATTWATTEAFYGLTP